MLVTSLQNGTGKAMSSSLTPAQLIDPWADVTPVRPGSRNCSVTDRGGRDGTGSLPDTSELCHPWTEGTMIV
jgi:hypothetical protein